MEEGRIGAERAQNTSVKALAGHLVSEHSMANKALRGLAGLDKLKSTPVPRFDEAMVQNVVIPLPTRG